MEEKKFVSEQDQEDKKDDPNKKIEELKRKIKEINEREQKSSGFKVKEKIGGKDTVSPDSDAEVNDLENEIRGLEKQQKIETKKAKIEELKKEIEALNKREQEPYKTENFKVKDKMTGTVTPDVEKMVLEKEKEIRELENRDGETIPGKPAGDQKEGAEKNDAEKDGSKENKEKDWMDKAGKEGVEKEREEKLAELEEAMKNARSNYAKKDYEATNVLARLKNFFGKGRIRTDSKDTSDIQGLYEMYKKTANDYLEFRVKDVQSKYGQMTPEERESKKDNLKKEMGGLVKYVNFDEKVNLYEARRQQMVESRKGTWSEKIFGAGKKLVDNYRKLNFKQQLAISALLMAGGAGALAVGSGFLVGTFAVAGVTRRVLGGASLAMGTTGLQEWGRGKLDKRASEKDMNKTMGDLEKIEDLNEKFEAFRGKLQAQSDTFKTSLETKNRKDISRKLVGIGVGGAAALLGPMVASYVKDYFLGHMGVPGGIKTGMTETSPKGGGMTHFEKDVRGSNLGRAGIAPAEVSGGKGNGMIVEKPKFIDLEVKKGSSLEGAVIKNLTDHGVDKVEAGKVAHRMALQFAQEHSLEKGPFSLVHPGTHIQFSPDGTKIMGVTGDNKLGWIEKGPRGGKHFSLATQEQVRSAGAMPDQIPKGGAAHGANAAVENAQGGKASGATHNAAENIAGKGTITQIGDNKNFVTTYETGGKVPLANVTEKFLVSHGMDPAAAHQRAIILANEYTINNHLGTSDKFMVPSGTKIEYAPDGRILHYTPEQGTGSGASAAQEAHRAAPEVQAAPKQMPPELAAKAPVEGSAEAAANNLPESGPSKGRIAANWAGVGAVGLGLPILAEEVVRRNVVKPRREKKELANLDSNFSKYIKDFQEAKGEKDRRTVLMDVLKNVRENMVGKSKKLKSFEDLKKHNANEFLNDPANKNEPIVRYSKYVSEKYGITPNDSYTLDIWTRRIVARLLSKRQNESALAQAA